MAKTRALMTETERDRIAEREDVEDIKRYQAISRVRSRIEDELTEDIAILEEHHDGLLEELRDVVCDDQEAADVEAAETSPDSAGEPQGSDAGNGGLDPSVTAETEELGVSEDPGELSLSDLAGILSDEEARDLRALIARVDERDLEDRDRLLEKLDLDVEPIEEDERTDIEAKEEIYEDLATRVELEAETQEAVDILREVNLPGSGSKFEARVNAVATFYDYLRDHPRERVSKGDLRDLVEDRDIDVGYASFDSLWNSWVMSNASQGRDFNTLAQLPGVEMDGDDYVYIGADDE